MNTMKKVGIRFEYIAAAIVLALQIVIVYNAYFITGWDSEVIIENAHMLATEHTYLYASYFSQYPNNILTMYIFTLIKTIVGSITFDDWLLSFRWILYFQCFLNVISGLLVFKICELRANRITAWIGYFFYMALVAFSPWMLIAYTDAIGVIFPTLMLFIYFRMVACRKEGKQSRLMEIIPFVLIGAVGAVAFNIKPQPVIVFIAIVGICFISVFLDKKFIKLITQVGVMIVAFLLVYFAIKLPTYYLNPNIDKNEEIGMTHFLMMGVNEESMGSFSADDVYFSASFETKEQRSKAELAEYKRRVSAMGAGRYAKYVGKKLFNMFTNGEFGWPAYTENGEKVNDYFFRNMLGEPKNKLTSIIRATMYGESRGHRLLTIGRNICWFITLLLIFAGIILQRNSQGKFILYLALFGFVLFSALFEYGPRYVYVFAEVFIITAMQTLYTIFSKITEAKKAKSAKQ